MLKYVLKRLLLAVPIFICITLVVFLLSNLAPGSPVDIIASNANLSDEQIEELKVAYGLDKPVIVRYGIWLADLSGAIWACPPRPIRRSPRSLASGSAPRWCSP